MCRYCVIGSRYIELFLYRYLQIVLIRISNTYTYLHILQIVFCRYHIVNVII
jgi:hypothetical protein